VPSNGLTGACPSNSREAHRPPAPRDRLATPYPPRQQGNPRDRSRLDDVQVERGIFRANHAKAIYAALGIEKREIEAWQNYIETHFNVMRRMADYHYARAATWGELQAIHDRFFQDCNQQPHAAHGDRPKGRRSPATVLGWVQDSWCDPADLDRLFRLAATRVRYG
jgi:hypothetical protein